MLPVLEIAKTGNNLATKNTPATTIVAACINAETGVGPSMASGNQICNGNIALLPAPPIKTNTTPHDNAEMHQERKLLLLILIHWIQAMLMWQLMY